MEKPEMNVVTGAFSHSGKYIAGRLLAMGESVKTLTGHPDRENQVGGRVSAHPFNFDSPARLVESLQGATTLYNTYWIRFSHRWGTFDEAVEHSLTLIKAAEEAGIRRMVHVSITSPSEDSPFPGRRVLSSTTLPGCLGDFPCLLSPVRGITEFSPYLWKIWRI
jgi:NADH dehydrogenase